MSFLDKDVAKLFKENEMLMTKKISSLLENNNMTISNIEEKIHIIVGLVDNFCHEVVYHQHKELDYKVMKQQVIDAIIYLLR